MNSNSPLNCPIDLDALDELLISHHAPDNSTGLGLRRASVPGACPLDES